MIKLKNVINKHKSNKIKENSNTVRHLNNGTDHRHSKSCCDQSSPARRIMIRLVPLPAAIPSSDEIAHTHSGSVMSARRVLISDLVMTTYSAVPL